MEFLRRQVTLPTQALDRFRMNTKSVSSFYGSDIVFKGHRIPAFAYCCDATIKHGLWSVKRRRPAAGGSWSSRSARPDRVVPSSGPGYAPSPVPPAQRRWRRSGPRGDGSALAQPGHQHVAGSGGDGQQRVIAPGAGVAPVSSTGQAVVAGALLGQSIGLEIVESKSMVRGESPGPVPAC